MQLSSGGLTLLMRMCKLLGRLGKAQLAKDQNGNDSSKINTFAPSTGDCDHKISCVRLVCRLAKERSAEDHLFGDKEKFVTAAYKKKLEEEKQWLAAEKLREAEERKNDVVKKGHMGDFYRSAKMSKM